MLALGVIAPGACDADAWQPGISTLAAPIELAIGDERRPARPSLVDDESLAQGLVQRATAAPQIVYSNFSDGTTTLTRGPDNAPRNTSSICWGVYPAWSGDTARARTLQAQMQEIWKDFNVVLAARRPASGPYTMVMVGPPASNDGCAGGLGVAPGDCGNRNPNDVAFSFPETGFAKTMAHEVGHTFGLEHESLACDVMSTGTTPACPSGDYSFQDTVGPLYEAGDCTTSTQNSYQTLKKVLGDWPGGPHPDPMGDGSLCKDAAPPVVTFLEPGDGARVGRDFKVRAMASDDCGLQEVKVEVPAQGLSASAATAPFEWDLTGVADDPHLEIVLSPTDAAGNAGTPVRIFVKVGAGGAGGGGAGGNGGNGSGGGGGGGTHGGTPGAIEGTGCAVAGGGPAELPGGLALLGLVAWRRKRDADRAGRSRKPEARRAGRRASGAGVLGALAALSGCVTGGGDLRPPGGQDATVAGGGGGGCRAAGGPTAPTACVLPGLCVGLLLRRRRGRR